MIVILVVLKVDPYPGKHTHITISTYSVYAHTYIHMISTARCGKSYSITCWVDLGRINSDLTRRYPWGSCCCCWCCWWCFGWCLWCGCSGFGCGSSWCLGGWWCWGCCWNWLRKTSFGSCSGCRLLQTLFFLRTRLALAVGPIDSPKQLHGLQKQRVLPLQLLVLSFQVLPPLHQVLPLQLLVLSIQRLPLQLLVWSLQGLPLQLSVLLLQVLPL